MSVVSTLGCHSNAQRVHQISALEPPIGTGLDVRANPSHRVLGNGSRADRERRQTLTSPRAQLDVRLPDARGDSHDLIVQC